MRRLTPRSYRDPHQWNSIHGVIKSPTCNTLLRWNATCAYWRWHKDKDNETDDRRLFYYRKMIVVTVTQVMQVQVMQTYREFQDRHDVSHCEDVSKFWPTKGEAITLFDTVKAVIAALSENLSALTPVPRRRNPVFCCRKDWPKPGSVSAFPHPELRVGWEKLPQSANDLPHCRSPVLASYPSRKMMCHSQVIVCSRLFIIEM